MAVSGVLARNIRYWTQVLNVIENLAPAVTVRAKQTLHLDDEFFDRPDASDASWYLLDPGRYDLFLDDSVGTVHLANLTDKVNYVAAETKLVTWYGHDSERYRILLNSFEGVSTTTLTDSQLAWFAWDTRAWTLYAHDGKLIMPVFDATELAGALDLDPNARIWMGWNGITLDVFAADPRHLPADLCAAFVGEDDSVGIVHRVSS
jgi:hypothetical protein